MHVDDDLQLSDRQARAVILAAEALGFEREPDLYEACYDHGLHDDARDAVRFLRRHDRGALRVALVAEEPIAPEVAARRITDTGSFSLWHADLVLDAAARQGFIPPPSDLPLSASSEQWEQSRAALAFLWAHHPIRLAELLGDVRRIAPLPDTTRSRWRHD